MSKINLAGTDYTSLPTLAKETGIPAKTLLATIKKHAIGFKKIGGTHFIDISAWEIWCKQ